MKDLFQQIAEVHAKTDGWCDLDKANTLAALVLALRPAVICEVGIFAGRSFLPMALAQKHINHGKIIGVEPWTNAAAVEGYEGENLEFWRTTVDFDVIRSKFKRALLDLGLLGFVTIAEVKSDDFEPVPMDLFHCDGQHTEQAVRDVQRYCPLIRVGGVAVLDDISWNNLGDQPVIRAAEWLEQNGFIKLYPLGTGAVFQRIT